MKSNKNELEELPLCLCGCGERVSKKDNKWIYGHQNRTKKYWEVLPKSKLCECGCNEYAKPGNRFIIGHNNRGLKHTDIYKKKMSQAVSAGNRKRAKDPKYRQKISNSLMGHKVSDETKQKISIANKGKKISFEQSQARSKRLTGHKVSDETKQKISESQKGIKKSFEQCKKISATKQGISYDEWETFAINSVYCPAFNEECRESNREKYGRRCFLSDKPEEENITKNGKQWKLSVHHVDMDKNQGCDGIKWKLIPLCLEWHSKAHSIVWQARIIWLLNNVWK